MPLVHCPDCEQEVSDSAPACPRCGRPSPGGTCTLVVSRPGKMLFLSPLEVVVDGNRVGEVGSGKTLSLAVPPGSHRLQVEITPPRQQRKTSAVDIQIPGSATVTAAITFSKLSGKIAIQVS